MNLKEAAASLQHSEDVASEEALEAAGRLAGAAHAAVDVGDRRRMLLPRLTIVCAPLGWRSPPRSSRWRTDHPGAGGIGGAHARRAKAVSRRRLRPRFEAVTFFPQSCDPITGPQTHGTRRTQIGGHFVTHSMRGLTPATAIRSVRCLVETPIAVSSATILGVTGIVVSGVVGPVVAAWANRRGDLQRFERDPLQRRRDDLRAIVDEGAALLGAGETNLRLAHEAASRGEREPAGVGDWAINVHLLGQRLLLRLSSTHPVVTAYEEVREALVAVGETYGDAASYPAAVTAFEARRTDFLDKARAELVKTPAA
jgi:hypothetical protein